MDENGDQVLQQPGLDALRKERERADNAERLLKELQAKVQAGDVLAGELNNTKSALSAEQKKREDDIAEYQSKLKKSEEAIAALRIEQAFKRSAEKAKLNPTYSDLVLKANIADFVVSEAGVLSRDGKTLDDWIESKKSEMPQLFLPPDISGSGVSPHGRVPASTGKKVVSRENANDFLTNIDAIAKGEVDTI